MRSIESYCLNVRRLRLFLLLGGTWWDIWALHLFSYTFHVLASTPSPRVQASL